MAGCRVVSGRSIRPSWRGDERVHVAGTTQLDDGTRHAVRYTGDADAALGLRIAATGQLVKARLASGEYLLFRGLPKYQVEQRVAAEVGGLVTARARSS